MLNHSGVDTNLRFLILEVRKQLERTLAFFRNPSPGIVESVPSRDDYIDNLRSIIQRKCFAQVATMRNASHPDLDLFKAIDVVAPGPASAESTAPPSAAAP